MFWSSTRSLVELTGTEFESNFVCVREIDRETDSIVSNDATQRKARHVPGINEMCVYPPDKAEHK